ncbi:MAG: hypothetical protein C3F02_00900 [Parcubacteria group bacterium]|nr:MAG: hypothetical protein C3F02_00900 [Parcubacteria group bacterium]
MKRPNFITNIILVPLDFCLIILAALSAYYFRFSDGITQIRPVLYGMPFVTYLSLVLKVALFAVFIFAWSGFYTMKARKLSGQFLMIISGVSTVVVFLILAIFLKRELFSSRFIIVLAWALCIIYLFLIRLIIRGIKNYFLRRGRGLAAAIILGDPSSRQPIINGYKNNLQLGYRVMAEFDNLDQLREWVGQNARLISQVDHIIQADSSATKDEALDLLTFCQENHLTLKYVASLFQAQSLRNIVLSEAAGLPIVEIMSTPLDGWRKVWKRLFDILISLVLLIILSPLFLILAIIIKSTSEGPVFFSVRRVGVKGNFFQMYKFRSMIKNADKLKSEILQFNERNDGPLFKMKNDPRVTSFGRWLRRTSFDELPQLCNVLKGEMSLVGPRPHEPEEVLRYERGYRRLLTIKPGISGMAQVSGRSNLLFTEEAKLDIFYIENWSILLDVIILLKTLRVPWQNREGY